MSQIGSPTGGPTHIAHQEVLLLDDSLSIIILGVPFLGLQVCVATTAGDRVTY
jgi:hypothetical protein